jgi:hypothetical protein
VGKGGKGRKNKNKQDKSEEKNTTAPVVDRRLGEGDEIVVPPKEALAVGVSLGQTDSPHQIVETRIRAQRRELWPHFQVIPVTSSNIPFCTLR